MTSKKTLLFPSYLPAIASFAAMVQHEVVWEVSGNYQKQSLRNRAYVTNDRGKHTLTIPVQGKGELSHRRSYDQIPIDNSQPWQRTHWRTLQTAYRTSPFFEYYEQDLEPLFTGSHDFLLAYNLAAIKTICECLQIPFSENYTTVFEKEPQSTNDHRHLINPTTPKDCNSPEYQQVFGDRHGFIPNLSILDLLFNEGPNALVILKNTLI
jgi:hypothetical protein